MNPHGEQGDTHLDPSSRILEISSEGPDRIREGKNALERQSIFPW